MNKTRTAEQNFVTFSATELKRAPNSFSSSNFNTTIRIILLHFFLSLTATHLNFLVPTIKNDAIVLKEYLCVFQKRQKCFAIQEELIGVF